METCSTLLVDKLMQDSFDALEVASPMPVYPTLRVVSTSQTTICVLALCARRFWVELANGSLLAGVELNRQPVGDDGKLGVGGGHAAPPFSTLFSPDAMGRLFAGAQSHPDHTEWSHHRGPVLFVCLSGYYWRSKVSSPEAASLLADGLDSLCENVRGLRRA